MAESGRSGSTDPRTLGDDGVTHAERLDQQRAERGVGAERLDEVATARDERKEARKAERQEERKEGRQEDRKEARRGERRDADDTATGDLPTLNVPRIEPRPS